jgi:hypothetical protein
MNFSLHTFIFDCLERETFYLNFLPSPHSPSNFSNVIWSTVTTVELVLASMEIVHNAGDPVRGICLRIGTIDGLL